MMTASMTNLISYATFRNIMRMVYDIIYNGNNSEGR